MHTALKFTPIVLQMGTVMIESMRQVLNIENNVHLSKKVENREESDNLLIALSNYREIEISMADQFWGDYNNFTDKSGMCLMLNFRKGQE
jgi:uncharacterized glyoxalase superfamily protein PhnB